MSQGALSRLEHGKGVPTPPLLERPAAGMTSRLMISVSPSGEVRVVFGAPAGSTDRQDPNRRLPVRGAARR